MTNKSKNLKLLEDLEDWLDYQIEAMKNEINRNDVSQFKYKVAELTGEIKFARMLKKHLVHIKKDI